MISSFSFSTASRRRARPRLPERPVAALGPRLIRDATLLLAVWAIAGCGAVDGWLGGGGPERTPAKAIWIAPDSAELTPSLASRLEAVGVEEILLTVATFDGDSLVRHDPPDLPTGRPLHMAIGGRLSARSADAAETAAERVSEAARQIRLDLEGRGLLVSGICLDFVEVADLDAYAAFLESFHDRLDDDELLVTASFQRGWERRDGARGVADAVDSLIAFFYGQRLDEAEDADAWDFLVLEQRLEDLEALRVPYQLGIVTVGSAKISDARGAEIQATTRAAMQDILWNRDLKLRPGFTLDGVNRRVYALGAERPSQLGDTPIPRDGTVRVVRMASADLEELQRLLEVWDLPNYRGQVFYRLAGEGETLSTSAESLMAALDPDRPVQPDLKLEVALQRRTGRGWLVRFAIANGNGEFTELAMIDNNFLQVRALDGRFSGSNLSLGDFYRFELYRERGGELKKTFRDAGVVRLHVPMLEGDQRISTGDVEVVGRREPSFEVFARFLLPDGSTHELGPARWSGGSFADAPTNDGG